MSEIQITEETRRVWHNLAAMPQSSGTLSAKEADRLLLRTGGWIMAQGEMYDFEVKPLSASVVRVSLKLKEFS